MVNKFKTCRFIRVDRITYKMTIILGGSNEVYITIQPFSEQVYKLYKKNAETIIDYLNGITYQ